MPYQKQKSSKSVSSHDSNVKPIEYKKVAAWQLRKLGYTISQTAQALDISTTTVQLYDKEADKYFSDLPAVRLCLDRMKTMIPRAMAVYERALESDDKKLAKDTARDVLISHKILKDRHTVEVVDDAGITDGELTAEAERIIARSAVQAQSDHK